MAFYDTDVRYWIEQVKDKVDDVGDDLYNFSYRYSDHFILKYVVTWITLPLWKQGQSIEGKLTLLAQKAGHIHDFVQDLLSGWLLDDLIVQIFGEWRSFRRDPVYWIILKINQVWPDFYWWAQDPLYMLEFVLGDRWSFLKRIYDDPIGWVFYKIREIWPDFYWFVQDPAYMVSFWIMDRFPFLHGFFADPPGWLREKIAGFLNVPLDFFDDPWGWILYIVKQKLDEKHPYYLSWLRTWGESVLRYFYEGKL